MRAARRDLPALTRLWQACFGDPEAEVRAFWQALFDCTPVYLRRAPDGSPAAMLCALPAELVGDDGDAVPAAYLYAVCTAPALRGRGHCRLLLQEAEQDLAKQGIRAAVLVPAEESLFGFYTRFGYRTVFTCRTAASRRSRRTAGRACASCSSMTAICPIRRSCCAGRKRSPAAAGLAFTASRRAMPSAAPRRSGTAKRCSCASCCRTARRPPPHWRTSSAAGRPSSARRAARSPLVWLNRWMERRSRSGPTSARRLSKAGLLHWLPSLSLRGPKGAVAISGRYRLPKKCTHRLRL